MEGTEERTRVECHGWIFEWVEQYEAVVSDPGPGLEQVAVDRVSVSGPSGEVFGLHPGDSRSALESHLRDRGVSDKAVALLVKKQPGWLPDRP